MNLSKILLTWCRDNHRAIVTKEERAIVIQGTAEVTRIRSHYEKYAVGKANRDFKAVRNAYHLDSSDANFAKLDAAKGEWMAVDRVNAEQRGLINLSLNAAASICVKASCPAILRRAANAVAWLSCEVTTDEKKRCELFGHPFSTTPLILALAQEVANLGHRAKQVESPHWTMNLLPQQIGGLEWLPDLLDVEGEVWNPADTVDPAQKSRQSKSWRNIGQLENSLFDPVMSTRDDTAAASVMGKSLVKYPDAPVKAPLVECKTLNLEKPGIKEALLASADAAA